MKISKEKELDKELQKKTHENYQMIKAKGELLRTAKERSSSLQKERDSALQELAV